MLLWSKKDILIIVALPLPIIQYQKVLKFVNAAQTG